MLGPGCLRALFREPIPPPYSVAKDGLLSMSWAEMGPKKGVESGFWGANVGANGSKSTFYPLWPNFGMVTKSHVLPTF